MSPSFQPSVGVFNFSANHVRTAVPGSLSYPVRWLRLFTEGRNSAAAESIFHLGDPNRIRNVNPEMHLWILRLIYTGICRRGQDHWKSPPTHFLALSGTPVLCCLKFAWPLLLLMVLSHNLFEHATSSKWHVSTLPFISEPRERLCHFEHHCPVALHNETFSPDTSSVFPLYSYRIHYTTAPPSLFWALVSWLSQALKTRPEVLSGCSSLTHTTLFPLKS